MFTQKDRVELEEVMDCNKPIASAVLPRWKRKALVQAQQAGATGKVVPPMAASAVTEGTPKVSHTLLGVLAVSGPRDSRSGKSVVVHHRIAEPLAIFVCACFSVPRRRAAWCPPAPEWMWMLGTFR